MINLFKGEYAWLSNMILVNVKYDGIEYPSVEHGYMSAKSDDMVWKSRCADKQIPPKQIKKESKDIDLRDDWDDVKIDVMRECLKEKFNQEPFKTLLINTKNQDLIEGNWWNDTFWGVDIVTGEGENNLGKLIMQIRYENRTKE